MHHALPFYAHTYPGHLQLAVGAVPAGGQLPRDDAARAQQPGQPGRVPVSRGRTRRGRTRRGVMKGRVY